VPNKENKTEKHSVKKLIFDWHVKFSRPIALGPLFFIF